MAKKKGVHIDIETLKKVIKEKKVIYGTDRTMKLIREGKAAKVFIASNCPADVRADLDHYQGISDFTLILLEISNDELGTICRKPYSVSMLSEPKE